MNKLSKIFNPRIRQKMVRSFSVATEFASGYNLELFYTQKEIQELAWKFTREVIIPVAAKLDRAGQNWGLIHIIKKVIWELFDSLVSEELAYGCTRVVMRWMLLEQIPVILAVLTKKSRQNILEDFLEASLVALNAGSDMAGIKTKAEKKGKEWIINGTKM